MARIVSYADLLDRYGDARDAAQTKAVLKRYIAEIEIIRTLVGATSSGQKNVTQADPLNNKDCPVSNMPVGSMEPGASLIYKGKKIGLCCQGCEATFNKDPEVFYQKALKLAPK